ncbi:MAG: Ig-like domain-containing protein [Chromatiaceae bacterium]
MSLTATDNAGNSTTTADTTNATLDNIAPTVSSSVVSGSPAAADSSVTFTVSYSEAVANLSVDDFTLAMTGTASGTIAAVSAASGSSVDVTVNSISGNGTLKMNMNGSTNVIDDAGNVVAAYSNGAAHTVLVPTAPAAPTIGVATAGNGQVSVTFNVPGNDGGSAITGYTVTSSPGGFTGTGASSPIVVAGLSNGTAYTFTVTATNAIGSSVASAASNAVTPKANQTITFTNPGSQNFGTTPTLNATADSGLTVSFSSSTSGVCTVSGTTLTFVTAGTCTIDADQAGDSTYLAATQVSQTFTVNAIAPGAPTIGSATAGDSQATVSFSAPASNGGTSITGYTVTASPGGATGTGSGSPITVTGLSNGVAYTFTVTATHAGGTSTTSAASNSITPAAPQTITFNNPGAQNFGTTPTLSASSSAGGGYPVTFTSATSGVCTITSGGALTFVTAGTCTINANQAGDSSVLAATQVSQSFAVNAVVPGAPTIGTATAGDTQASVAFIAPVNTGGTAITGYTVSVSPVDVAPVSGASSPIVVTGLTNGQTYTFTVTANNAAGTSPASAASNSITPKAEQTITFANPGAQNFGTTPTLSATADSGLTVSFSTSTSGVCTVSGSTLTFITAGTCTINADQAGDGTYLAATQVSRSFSVNAVVPGAPTAVVATAGIGQASVSFTAPVFNGGNAITSYTVTSSPGGFNGTGSGSPIVVTGLSNGETYSFTVTATNGVGTGSASAASSPVLLAADQTITFANPGAQNFGATPTLSATTSAGGGYPITFTSTTTGVCTVTSGGLLTFVTTGTCTINADQAGDETYLAAPTVSRSFSVNAVVPAAPTIGAAVAGETQATIAFSAPAFTGGSVITGYTVTANPGGFTGTGSGSPIIVSGLTNGTAYTFTVTATNSAGTSVASAASNSVTPQGSQTITFANPGAQLFGTTPTLTATATSGLPVLFTSATGAVCTISSAGALSFIATGTCTINANQAGDGTYLAATQVSQSFAVNADIPDAPVIDSVTVVDGNQVSVSFTPPSFDGGAGITSYTVTSVPGGLTATGTGSPLVVSGLTAGTSYRFFVTASNVAGTSGASGLSDSVTPQDPNTAPVISGNPATSIRAGMPYSFMPSASDADAADTLTFSISNKPAWATFSTSTGSLTGTPAQTDAGVSSGIVISVSDGKVTSSLPAFNLQVLANTAPVATSGSSELNEDEAVSFALGGTDADGDTLTVQIQTQPKHGSLKQSGEDWLYTPQKDFSGEDSLSFVVKDAGLTSEPATYRLTVTPVNDAPLAIDDNLTIARSANDQYSLSVLGNDKDVDGDTLQLAGASTGLGTVTITGNNLNFTAPAQYVGPVTLQYSVSDGKKGLATATVNLTITGTPGSVLPVITVPADITVNATALFTRVPLGTATAVDNAGRRLRVVLINGSLFYAPGLHQVHWQATDAAGNTATKMQQVIVQPLVSLSKDQTVVEGSSVSVEVILNGPAPQYPVEVPYTLSGTAGGNDHTLVSGVATISSGQSTVLQFDVLDDGLADDNESLTVTLSDTLNRGAQRSSTIRITEANVAPVVSLNASQQDEARLTVSQNGGLVTLTANATDANASDQLTLSWQSDLTLSGDMAASRSFDPATVTPGVYPISVVVSDNGTPVRSTTAQLYLVVQASLPTLGNTDTDGDLIPDNQEGFADTDRDGIPDYKDSISECNVVPEADIQQNAFLAEGEPGACLRRGQQSILASSGGLELGLLEVETDTAAVNIGGIFDFIANGLPQAGQSYQLVLPQRLPVPANAVYRKFNDATGWKDFVSNSKNHVRSAPGERGFCPPPGDAVYTAGLTEGHWCVQVTVEDGGPNDADGIANAAIVDPGGVAVLLSSNKLPQAKADTATTRMNQLVSVNVLSNDTDADNDKLSVSQAVANFGSVKIEADGKLTYTPAPDFIGTDVVIYSVTDGKGGTGSTELTITVRLNNLPSAVNDSAATDDRTAISINVLSNDSDADSDPLKVLSASATSGSVTIDSDNRLRYTPKAGFNGVDIVSYRISDGFGGEATGQVSITVTAYQTVTVSNKSSGGAISVLWAGVLLMLGLGRRYRLLALLLCASTAQAADFGLQLGVGQSKANQADHSVLAGLPSGTLRNLDDSDMALSLSLQWQWLERLDLELGYQDLGDASVDLSTQTLTPAQYHQAVQSLTPVLGDGLFTGVRIGLWQQQSWRLQLPMGLMTWQSEIDSSMNGSTLRNKTDGTDLYYGLALQYLPNEHWVTGVGWQQIALEPEDVRVVQFTLSYRF